jgi:hypothetical protein
MLPLIYGTSVPNMSAGHAQGVFRSAVRALDDPDIWDTPAGIGITVSK